jgi:hypothetical protein
LLLPLPLRAAAGRAAGLSRLLLLAMWDMNAVHAICKTRQQSSSSRNMYNVSAKMLLFNTQTAALQQNLVLQLNSSL